MSGTLTVFVTIWIAPGLLTFYSVCRRYTLRLRAYELKASWDEFGVFMFSVAMGVIWPLALLWTLATRPSREEKKATQQRRISRIIAETERRARELGVGS